MALVVYNAKSPIVEELKRGPERTFRLGERMLRLKQKWLPGGDGGTLLGHGASVYDAAFVLADYLHRNQTKLRLRGQRCVELGTGPGLGAIAAGLLGCAEVVATDGDAELLALTAENMDLNLGGDERPRCTCAKLLWGNQAAAAALRPPFDLVLAADCAAVVYESAFEDLVASLVDLSGDATVVLLSYHRRHYTEDTFFELLAAHFTTTRVPDDDVHPDFRHSDISVFELRRKPRPLPPADAPDVAATAE